MILPIDVDLFHLLIILFESFDDIFDINNLVNVFSLLLLKLFLVF